MVSLDWLHGHANCCCDEPHQLGLPCRHVAAVVRRLIDDRPDRSVRLWVSNPVHSSVTLLNEGSFVSSCFTSTARVNTYSLALPVVLFDKLASSLALNSSSFKTGHGRLKRKRGIAGQAPSTLNRNIVLLSIFNIRTPSPLLSIGFSPPNSPTHEGENVLLLGKFRTDRLDASGPIFELSDRISLLEAEKSVNRAINLSLRRELDRNKQRRRSKPIHSNQERGRACFWDQRR